MMRVSKDLASNLVLVLGSLLLSGAAAEIFLRTLAPIPHSMDLEYIPDGHLGARLRPSKTYRLRSGGLRSVNNLGFRGTRHVSLEKPAGAFRLVVLGGSAAFSSETPDGKTWPEVLERKLSERYGDHVEVINAAIPGYSVFESKINYLYRVRQLTPDAVLVYHTWNDMKFFHRIETGDYPDKGVANGYNAVERFFRGFQLVLSVRGILRNVVMPARRENSFGSAVPAGGVRIEQGGRAHRWERQNYDDLAVLIEKDGVLPIFANQAGLLSTETLDDPPIRAVIRAELVNLTFAETLRQWLAVSDIIESVADEHGIAFVNVYEKTPHDRRYFLDHVHLTELGDALVGQIMFEVLSADSAFVTRIGTSPDLAVTTPLPYPPATSPPDPAAPQCTARGARLRGCTPIGHRPEQQDGLAEHSR